MCVCFFRFCFFARLPTATAANFYPRLLYIHQSVHPFIHLIQAVNLSNNRITRIPRGWLQVWGAIDVCTGVLMAQGATGGGASKCLVTMLSNPIEIEAEEVDGEGEEGEEEVEGGGMKGAGLDLAEEGEGEGDMR